jgi:acyl-CoA synthetase (AMP-forming)/AMP-acid ligase II/acyl carrier protein
MDRYLDLVTLARGHAQTRPDDTAYTYEREQGTLCWSYAELDRQARRVAAQLQTFGEAGQRALLLYPPGPEFLAGFFGCLYAGWIAVPAYPPRWPPRPHDSSLRRLLAVAQEAAPTVVLTTQLVHTQVGMLSSALPELSTVKWVASDVEGEITADHWQPWAPRSEDLAFLQYTSGSTDKPKGVMVSHANLLANEEMINRAFRINDQSIGGGWVPLFHDMGLIGHVLGALCTGRPCHLMDPRAFVKRPLSWLELITRYRITHSTAPDFAYRMCVDTISDDQKATLDLSCWELALNGAEPVRAETIDRFSAAFAGCGFRRTAFYPSYGLAEATLFVSGANEQREPVRVSARRSALDEGKLVEVDPATTKKDVRDLVSCGRGATGQRLEIVDPHTRKALPEGHVGEIWVAGPHIPVGYWRQPELSQGRFGVALADSDEKIFLRTGDLGVLQRGELYIVGRLSDLIVIRGVNHYPEDIERTVERLDHRFLMPCIASVEVDDQERLVLIQEVRRDFPADELPSTVVAVREALAEHHGLELYACVLVKQGTLPRTSSGKVQRLTCGRRFLGGELDVLASWTRSAEIVAETEAPASFEIEAGSPDNARVIEAWLQQRAAKLLGVEVHEIGPDRQLAEYGLDSAASVMLAGELEAWLGVQIPETISWDYPTISAIAGFLATQVTSPGARPTVHNGSAAMVEA